MSSRTLLSTVHGRRPILELDRAILGAPVRHVFMIGTAWYLARRCGRPSLSVLEVGSWCGASALSWAQGVQEYCGGGSITCVDAWTPFFSGTADGASDYAVAMDAMLASDVAYDVFLHNMSTLPGTIVAQHVRGRSEHVLPQLREAQYDIVFVDANHAYSSIRADLSAALPLLRDGGVVCGDDLNRQMHECDAAHAEANRERDLATEPVSGRNYHPGVTVAVAELFGRVSSWAGFWAMQRAGDRWRPISLRGMPIVYPAHFPERALADARSHFADLPELA
jgi:predicted O-methyltransferase YrrM